MSNVSAVTMVDFDREILEREGLVLLDLWAPWCAPCRAIAPVLDDLSEDFAGEVTVRKVDVEAEGELRTKLAVSGIPTLILYRDGVEIERATGAQTRARLSAWLERHL